MQDNKDQTLFQDAPPFPNLRTKEAWLKKILYKLDKFREQGGDFREMTVDEFERSRGYEPKAQTSQNNCYSSATGVLTYGDCLLSPGHLSKLSMNEDGILESRNLGKIYMDYVEVDWDPMAFESKLQEGLKADQIIIDPLLSEIGNYYPIIGISYNHSAPHRNDIDMDYHFMVPHVTFSGDNNVSYAFSGRTGHRGNSEYFGNIQDMASYLLDKSCNRADVYFSPKNYLGKIVNVIDEKIRLDYQREKRLESEITKQQLQMNALILSHVFIGEITPASGIKVPMLKK